MSILATTPTATRHFDMNIAAALGDINAAVIVQQLDYWLSKEGVGVVIDGTKFVYNTFVDWVNSQFKWLSVWQFRKAMSLLRSLGIVEVIRYKATQWNQTNHYSLNYKRLEEWAKAEARLALGEGTSPSFLAESIETVEMCVTPPQDVNNQTLEMRDSKVSYIGTKNTSKEVTAKQTFGDRSLSPEKIADAQQETALKEEKNQKDSYLHSDQLKASPSQNKAQSEENKSNPVKEKKVGGVDYIVNKKLMSLLDSTGIPINKTIKDLLKLYPVEKVENAIALVRARKREQHIPNPSGYFVAALKGDWGASVTLAGDREEVDQVAVFRHWYDLARELGYCSGQEVREGQQWVCLSGSWEPWRAAVKRGYSLEYLKKVIKRNQGQ